MIHVKELRKSKGLSQSELAETLGVSRTTVTMWESGGQDPKLETVVRLANVLSCTIDELVGCSSPRASARDSA